MRFIIIYNIHNFFIFRYIWGITNYNIIFINYITKNITLYKVY